MRTACFAGLSCTVVQLLAATANISLIKKAFERPFGRAQILTAAGFSARVPVTTPFFWAFRSEFDRVAITWGFDWPCIGWWSDIDRAGFRLPGIH